MNKRQLLAYVAEQYGVVPDYPWTGTSSVNAVLRHPSNSKWFALVLPVAGCKLGLSTKKTVEIVLLKNDPLVITQLREQAGIYLAYHMNKEHWISVVLESDVCDAQGAQSYDWHDFETVSDEQLMELIDTSFILTAPRIQPKAQIHGTIQGKIQGTTAQQHEGKSHGR